MSDFEMNELAMLQAHFWNLFYEVHGFRPRHLPIDTWSIEQIRSELDKMETTHAQLLTNSQKSV